MNRHDDLEQDRRIHPDIVVAVLEEKIKHIEEQNAIYGEKIAALEKDKENAFKWGIMALGGAVIALFSWVIENIIFRH